MPGAIHASSARPVSAHTLRNRQDARRFLERFHALTGFGAPAARAECLPRVFLERPILSPEALLARHGQGLSQRTRNALCRSPAAPESQDWTYERLLGLRGFGLFCLLDVLEAIARRNDTGPLRRR